MLRRLASNLLMAKEQSMINIWRENVQMTSRPIPELNFSLIIFSMAPPLFERYETV